MLSIEFREGISETLDILNFVDEIYLKKLPKKLKDFLEKNKLTNYKSELDHSKRLNEMNLKETTKDILSIIYLNYWCDPEEKNKYIQILKQNDKKYEDKLRAHYDSSVLFKKNLHKVENKQESSESMFLIEKEKDSFFEKIKKWLYSLFKIRKLKQGE